MKTGYTCPAGYNLVASATRDGRTLMAIVIGATSVKSRNEAAAGLLAKGFSQPTAGGLTLATLKPSGAGIDQATNMRDALCTKAGSTALRKKEREIAAQRKKEGKPEPASYLAKRDGPRELVPISIGTATGPASPAIAALLVQDAAREGRQGCRRCQEAGGDRLWRGSRHSASVLASGQADARRVPSRWIGDSAAWIRRRRPGDAAQEAERQPIRIR